MPYSNKMNNSNTDNTEHDANTWTANRLAEMIRDEFDGMSYTPEQITTIVATATEIALTKLTGRTEQARMMQDSLDAAYKADPAQAMADWNAYTQ